MSKLACAPDFAALPTPATNAYRAIDGGPAIVERVRVLAEVGAAEKAVAEGAFEAGMRATLFDPAEANTVALPDALAVAEMLHQVVVLGSAWLAAADGLVPLDEVTVPGTEIAPTVLTAVFREIQAAIKDAANLAVLGGHGIHPSGRWRP